MNFTLKTLGIIALVSLLLGFALGFVPEHRAKASVEDKVTALTAEGDTARKALRQTQNQLALNEFAVQAAVVSADANANNYADASTQASKLFTELREYVNRASNTTATQTLNDVLGARDQTIAGLAKADPGTQAELGQIFKKLQTLTSPTAQ